MVPAWDSPSQRKARRDPPRVGWQPKARGLQAALAQRIRLNAKRFVVRRLTKGPGAVPRVAFARPLKPGSRPHPAKAKQRHAAPGRWRAPLSSALADTCG